LIDALRWIEQKVQREEGKWSHYLSHRYGPMPWGKNFQAGGRETSTYASGKEEGKSSPFKDRAQIKTWL